LRILYGYDIKQTNRLTRTAKHFGRANSAYAHLALNRNIFNSTQAATYAQQGDGAR